MINIVKQLDKCLCPYTNIIFNYLNQKKYNFEQKYLCIKLFKRGGGYLSKIKVQHGPFKGMKYCTLNSCGSALCPKLLGSYEKELHGIINSIKKNEYSEILDIGCAEGYYAIGFAYLAKLYKLKTKVYAYDIDKKARLLCNSMAKVNEVKDKVVIASKCTSSTLANFRFTGKNLIISDCEGYEKDLIDKSVIQNLRNSDILIEVHEFNNVRNHTKSNFEYLTNLFNDTHKYITIYSIDDSEKVRKYKYKELRKLHYKEKFSMLAEGRKYKMKWLFFTPKNNF